MFVLTFCARISPWYPDRPLLLCAAVQYNMEGAPLDYRETDIMVVQLQAPPAPQSIYATVRP